MRMLLGFLLFLTVAGLSGMLVFLNQERIVLLLTPSFRGAYYTLPEMPLGLLVVTSFLLGFFFGYLSSLFTKLLR
ncbi:MAG: hypothetical protein RMH93_05865 [Aquificaceae bacterium]|nr:hypothetical protein [Aquificaceae bacterium]